MDRRRNAQPTRSPSTSVEASSAKFQEGLRVAALLACFNACQCENPEVNRRLSGSSPANWQLVLGGSDSDLAVGVVAVPNGVLVAGHTCSRGQHSCDVWLVELGMDGVVRGEHTYGAARYTESTASISPLREGGFVVGGRGLHPGRGGSDYWLIGVTATGELVWDTKVGSGMVDDMGGMVQTQDSGFAIVGTHSLDISRRVRVFDVVKVDHNGKTLWQHGLAGEPQTYEEIEDDENILNGFHGFDGKNIDETPAGDLVIASHAFAEEGNLWRLSKRRATGELLWEHGGGPDDYWDAPAVAATADGGLVAGLVAFEGALVRLDPKGEVLFERKLSESPRAILVRADGTLLVVGSVPVRYHRDDGWIALFSPTGDLLWSHIYSPSDDDAEDVLSAVVELPDGGYVAVGSAMRPIVLEGGVRRRDLWAIRVDADGRL